MSEELTAATSEELQAELSRLSLEKDTLKQRAREIRAQLDEVLAKEEAESAVKDMTPAQRTAMLQAISAESIRSDEKVGTPGASQSKS